MPWACKSEAVRDQTLPRLPRQLYLQDVLIFQFHLCSPPLLVAPDGRRLSKRTHDLDLGVLRDQGKTIEEILSFSVW